MVQLYFDFRLMLLSQVLSIIFPTMIAVDPYCNYYQNMDAGVKYYVYNKQYPGNYGPNENCLWQVVAPQGYVVEANCDMEMPNSSGCVDDRLLISVTGQPNLGNADVYCGNGNKIIQSKENIMSIGLQSSYMSRGGRFLCVLEAKLNDPTSCDCGWKNMRRIVGGVETKVNEYPMMAALVDLVARDIFCGATIVASRYAVSAAHCFKEYDINNVALLAGEHNITSGTETNATQLKRLLQVTKHAEYNPNDPLGVNDIAVIKTVDPIEFNFAVGPACLPFYYYGSTFAGEEVDVLGWGTTEFTGPKSDVLLKTDLYVLDEERCNYEVGGKANQMCTFKAGHDACQSDSGGPLLWLNNNSYRLYLVGVISSGFGCAASKPALNTRVTSYLMWIMANMPDANVCVKAP